MIGGLGALKSLGLVKGDKVSIYEEDSDPALFNADFDLIKHISES